MNTEGHMDIIKNALEVKPEFVVIGEVRCDDAAEMIKSMTTGHHISMEMHQEIRKKVQEEMLKEAFKEKDKETIKLIENTRQLDKELEKYRYL